VTINQSLSTSQTTILKILLKTTNYRLIHRATITKMPLVVPGLMNKSDNKSEDWANKLMGKKIGDSSDQIVSEETLNTRYNANRIADFCQEGPPFGAPRR
jgi:hypothetical protein